MCVCGPSHVREVKPVPFSFHVTSRARHQFSCQTFSLKSFQEKTSVLMSNTSVSAIWGAGTRHSYPTVCNKATGMNGISKLITSTHLHSDLLINLVINKCPVDLGFQAAGASVTRQWNHP